MSPIWIPWATFWIVALFVLMRIFQSIARRDRAAEMVPFFSNWDIPTLQVYVAKSEELLAQGLCIEADIDSLSAARIALKIKTQEVANG